MIFFTVVSARNLVMRKQAFGKGRNFKGDIFLADDFSISDSRSVIYAD